MKPVQVHPADAYTQAHRIFAYVRVSSAEQAGSGAGLAAQRGAILAEAERRGWEIVRLYQDAGVSAKAVAHQPQLQAALAALKAHQADGLVVAKLDRLTRSLGDFAHLLERSVKEHWAVVALDLSIDTSTPQGEAMANLLAVFARWERRIIGQRTKDALAVKRVQGKRFGRPPYMPPAVEQWLIKRYRTLGQRGSGKVWGVQTRIANELTRKASKDKAYAPPHGGQQWRQSTVRNVIARHRAQQGRQAA